MNKIIKKSLNLIFLPIDIILFIIKFLIFNPFINQAIKLEHKNETISNKIKKYIYYINNPFLLNKEYPIENSDISYFYFSFYFNIINMIVILTII